MRSKQQGNFLIGLVVGGVLGLGLALGVAVYVTKVPVPFVSKPQLSGADQDQAEALKNRDWDPNALLSGRATRPAPVAPAPAPVAQAPVAGDAPLVAPGGSSAPVMVPAPVTAPAVARPAANAPITVNPIRPGSADASSDPLGDLVRARTGGGSTQVAAAPTVPSGDEPFIYFVQAGAFRTQDDADAQRAKLSLTGVEARVTEREQAGRTVYRVRVGPFSKKEEADRTKGRLEGQGFEAALVRVQR